MSTILSNSPIGFDVYNDDEDQAIFITENIVGHSLTIEIENNSDKVLSPKVLSGPVSETNCHFELTFQANTIFNSPCAIRLAGGIFEMHVNQNAEGAIIPNNDGSISFYFKTFNGWSLNPGECMSLKLNHIRAEYGDGARHSTIKLSYQNLLHDGVAAPISGINEIDLDVVNKTGRRNIPMNLGFVGSNIVLNNSSKPNTVQLRVANIDQRGHILGATANSKLFLRIPGGANGQEWTLATDAQLSSMVVKYTLPGEAAVIASKTQGANEWEIPYKTLEPGQSINIELSNLRTDHNSGESEVKVQYKNIKGYWDGELVATIGKGPMVHKDEKTGIGTNNPDAKLAVVADANGNGISVKNPSGGTSFFPFTDNFNYLAGNGVIFRDSQNQEKVRIRTDTGNIGVGEPNPGARITVVPVEDGRGVEVISPTAGNTHFPYADNWNYISGKGVRFRHTDNYTKMTFNAEEVRLGIGAVPTETLDVNGTVYARSLRVNSSTKISQVQAGHFVCGTNPGTVNVKVSTIPFPQAFSQVPFIICTARGGGVYDDTFAVSVRSATTTSFTVNIRRVDSATSTGWAQNLQLDWIAITIDA